MYSAKKKKNQIQWLNKKSKLAECLPKMPNYVVIVASIIYLITYFRGSLITMSIESQMCTLYAINETKKDF